MNENSPSKDLLFDHNRKIYNTIVSSSYNHVVYFLTAICPNGEEVRARKMKVKPAQIREWSFKADYFQLANLIPDNCNTCHDLRIWNEIQLL